MKLETLYKTAKTGKIQVFDIEVNDDTYTVTWGTKDGKMQTKTTTCLPKNVGKANETTAEQQAVLEAQAVWVKKQKANYSTDASAPVTVNLPMKVSNYHDHKAKVKFPCYTSVKLNGVNAEYRLVNGELKLLSRGGEEYPILEHQREEALSVLKALGTTSINGEIYKHGLHLEDITAATKKPNDLTPQLQFWIFEFPEYDGTYQESCAKGYEILSKITDNNSTILPINVGVAYCHEDLHNQHAEVVSKGYEGIVIRNPEGKYKYNIRSMDVFKLKKAKDAEFQVSGYSLDKNGHAVFQCNINVDGVVKTFKVKQKGTNEERLEVAANADNYIGKWLNIEFETYSKYGIPLKPVGQYFRECDENGEAIE